MKVSEATMYRIVGVMDTSVYTFAGFMIGWFLGRA